MVEESKTSHSGPTTVDLEHRGPAQPGELVEEGLYYLTEATSCDISQQTAVDRFVGKGRHREGETRERGGIGV